MGDRTTNWWETEGDGFGDLDMIVAGFGDIVWFHLVCRRRRRREARGWPGNEEEAIM